MERRLGRGLGSLLGGRPTSPDGAADVAPEVESRAVSSSREEIALDRIRPNPFQPRHVFDAAGLQELRASILNHGILQPVVVRVTDDGFELVSGERRWRAARMAGLTVIPAVVRSSVSDDDMLELALVENLQRRDLDPIERAQGYQSMVERLGLTQDEIARRVGLQRATVANHLRLLELPAPIREAVSANRITMGHARALLSIPREADQFALAHAIEREGLSVREVERRVREMLTPASAAEVEAPSKPVEGGSTSPSAAVAEEPPRSAETWARALEERLKLAIGSKVEIRTRSEQGGGLEGQLVLHFYDRRQLEGLCDRIAPQHRI